MVLRSQYLAYSITVMDKPVRSGPIFWCTEAGVGTAIKNLRPLVIDLGCSLRLPKFVLCRTCSDTQFCCSTFPKIKSQPRQVMVFSKALPLSSLQAHLSQVGGGWVHPCLVDWGSIDAACFFIDFPQCKRSLRIPTIRRFQFIQPTKVGKNRIIRF